MTDLVATFRKPFAEAVAAFDLRLRELRPTYGAADPAYSGHNRAFAVAGAVKADLLADLAEAVRRARAEGTGYDAFVRDFRAIVETHGWHGWTGEGTARGEDWRMRTIYRTNMRTSWMAGRHAQLVAANYRWWVYRHSGAEHPRLNHLSWDGVALPPDHPFWAQHYPPNGWGCGCEVYGANTQAGIRRVGGVPGKGLPDGWDGVDPRTGLPPGIGRGWGDPPDRDLAALINAIVAKADELPGPIAVDLTQSMLTGGLFSDWLAAPSGNFPLVRVTDDVAARIGAQGRIAVLSRETALKQAREHPEIIAADYARAQAVIDTATEVIQDTARSLIFIRADPLNTGYLLVVKATASGEGLFVTSYRRISSDPAQRQRLLRQFQRRGSEGSE